MVAPYKGRLAIALLGMILTAATEPMLVAMMKVLLDHGFAADRPFPLWLVPVGLIGVFVLRGVSTFTTTYMMTWVSTRLLNLLRQAIFNRMLDVPLGFNATHPVGKVINAMMFEVQQIVDMIKDVFTSIIRDTLTVIGLMAYLLYLNWRLTLITLVLLPLIALIVRATGKRLRRLNTTYLGINAELTQVIEETTRAQQVIKIFGGQHYERARFAERAERLRGYAMRM
ncbi:MAG TPA: ABC transporter transmembrane domain-containing protein, partial [Noviherbaspirillum sp.]|nr:ABC transporter transmembrane domain-containing protein [Noviherbaspirillum sp.]